MLRLQTIATGSSGNMYLLDSDGKNLVIELGMGYKDLLLNIEDVRSIEGAIYTHKHSDHWQEKTERELLGMGYEVLSPNNTEKGKRYRVGKFDIIPLPAKHNVECCGYLIRVDGKTILFSTDTKVLPKVKNIKIDYFIIEVNFIERIWEECAKMSEDTHLGIVYQNHHSLENAVEYFSSLKYKPKKIVTIHRSSSGLFDKAETIESLSRFADEVEVAEGGGSYILEEIL